MRIVQVIEQFIHGKTDDLSICEDGLFISEDFLSIIDGATSTSKQLYDGKTTARVAKDVLLAALETLPKEVTGVDAIRLLDDALTEWYRKHAVYDMMAAHPAERCFASIILYSNFRRELWMVGNCQALLDETHVTNEKFVDSLFANVRAFFMETELLQGKTMEELAQHDTGYELVFPLVVRQTLFQNSDDKTFGFYNMDGFITHPKAAVKVVPVPEQTKLLVLASDGYPKLLSTLAASETALQEIVKADPLCFRENKQVKALRPGALSFDDRTYIRANLN